MLVAGRESDGEKVLLREPVGMSVLSGASQSIKAHPSLVEIPNDLQPTYAAGQDDLGDEVQDIGLASLETVSPLAPAAMAPSMRVADNRSPPADTGGDRVRTEAGGGTEGPEAAAIRASIERYFPASEWERAACIVWRESRGVLTAVSETDDWGPWQINRPTWQVYFEGLGLGWYPFDPDWSTRAARHIYDRAGGSFGPWTTNNGGDC